MLQKELVEDFRRRTDKVLVDSNLLLLFLVGIIDKRLISNFKRLRVFKGREIEAFETLTELLDLLASDGTLITLPNIMTEISNLANQADENSKKKFFKHFIKWFDQQTSLAPSLLKEQYIESRLVIRNRQFLFLHLTDTAIVASMLREENMITVTRDLSLYVEQDKHYGLPTQKMVDELREKRIYPGEGLIHRKQRNIRVPKAHCFKLTNMSNNPTASTTMAELPLG